MVSCPVLFLGTIADYKLSLMGTIKTLGHPLLPLITVIYNFNFSVTAERIQSATALR